MRFSNIFPFFILMPGTMATYNYTSLQVLEAKAEKLEESSISDNKHSFRSNSKKESLTEKQLLLTTNELLDERTLTDDLHAGISKASDIVEATSGVVDALSDLSTNTKLLRSLTQASSVLGVAGPILSIALAFLPEAPSEEFLLMKEEFDKISAQFVMLNNKVSAGFSDVMSGQADAQVQKWVGVLNGIEHEYNIFVDENHDSPQAKSNLVAKCNAEENAEDAFQFFYMHSCTQCLYKIDKAPSQYLQSYFEEAKYDFRKFRTTGVTSFSVNMMRAMYINGICLGYHTLGPPEDADRDYINDKISVMKVQFDDTIDTINTMERNLKCNWPTAQLDTDVNTEGHSSNTGSLYTFLTDKYFYVKWGVFTYNGGSLGWRNHAYYTVGASSCPGLSRNSKHYKEAQNKNVHLWWGPNYPNGPAQLTDGAADSVCCDSYTYGCGWWQTCTGTTNKCSSTLLPLIENRQNAGAFAAIAVRHGNGASWAGFREGGNIHTICGEQHFAVSLVYW